MTRTVVLTLLLAPAAILADDKKPGAKADAAALKGKWKVTAVRFDGKDLPAGADRVLVFDGQEFTAFDGEKKGRTLGYTLDPTSDPKRIDLTRAGDEQKALGLYALAGDTLTLCYGEPGAARPKGLASEAGGKAFLLVLERVKP